MGKRLGFTSVPPKALAVGGKRAQSVPLPGHPLALQAQAQPLLLQTLATAPVLVNSLCQTLVLSWVCLLGVSAGHPSPTT